MLRSRALCAAIIPFLFLPSCSLLIDTNPDGVIDKSDAAGSSGKGNSKGKGGTSGAAPTSNGGIASSSDTKAKGGAGGLGASTVGGAHPLGSNGGSGASATEVPGGAGVGTPSTPLSKGGANALTTTGGMHAGAGMPATGTPGGVAGSSSTTLTSATGGVVAKGGATQTGGASAAGGAAPSGGTPTTGGTVATGGAVATGGTTTTATCTDEGCACTVAATIACNDCGTRTCNTSTKRWGACSAPQSPASTQCADATTLQTCSNDGRWVPTTCTTSDATNCSASCVTGASSASCKVSAKDGDNDGHASKACAAAPGDDCDDGNRDVYPGAVEACDGLDNNCNGKADLNDGWSLSGTTLTETYPVMDMEWAPSISKFGMVTGGGSMYFGTSARATGTSHSTTWNNYPSVTENGYGYGGRCVVWLPSRGNFVLAYERTGRVSDGIVSNMDAQGVVSGNSAYIGTPLSLASRSAGDVLVVDGSSPAELRRYTGSALDAPTTINGNSNSFSHRIAASGNQSALIFEEPGNVVKWVRIDTSLNVGLPTQLSDAGWKPDIATVSNGYAVAWGTATGFDYQVRSVSTGASVCGPIHVSTASVAYLAVASTQYGTLVLTTANSGTEVRLFSFDDSCAVVNNVQVDSSGSGSPVIAVGGGYVALAWGYDDSSARTSRSRIVGEHLCN